VDRGGAIRFILLGIGGLFLFLTLQNFMGGGSGASQPLTAESQLVPSTRADEEHCDLWRPEFHATLRTRGGTLTHFELLTAKYRNDGKPLDLSTTPDPAGDHEFRQQLFAKWRADASPPGGTPWNLELDSFDYELVRADAKQCDLVYRGKDAEIRRSVRATDNRFELEVEDTIQNLASAPRQHAYSIDTVAWRLDHEVEGKMFRISPYVTHVECLPEADEAVRLLPSDFEPDDFKEENFAKGPRFRDGRCANSSTSGWGGQWAVTKRAMPSASATRDSSCR
jgi:hypothetical protein